MLIDDIIKVSAAFKSDLSLRLAFNLSQAIRFKVDNVASYVHETKYDRKVRIQDHIPNMAPLAPVMWFEYGGLSVGQNSFGQFGCMISIDYGSKEDIRMSKYGDVDIPEDIRWVLRMEYFIKTKMGFGASDYVYFIGVKVDGSGMGAFELPSQRWEETSKKNRDQYLPDLLSDSLHVRAWHEEIVIALTAICFAHCKGTEIKEHQPSRQVRRQAERKGEPVYTYRTIDIHPSARVLKEEGDIEKNGLAKALHICRGHFAHYTADKPLFGKYVGTVYRPMHVRGSAENGVVEKGYRVHAE